MSSDDEESKGQGPRSTTKSIKSSCFVPSLSARWCCGGGRIC